MWLQNTTSSIVLRNMVTLVLNLLLAKPVTLCHVRGGRAAPTYTGLKEGRSAGAWQQSDKNGDWMLLVLRVVN